VFNAPRTPNAATSPLPLRPTIRLQQCYIHLPFSLFVNVRQFCSRFRPRFILTAIVANLLGLTAISVLPTSASADTLNLSRRRTVSELIEHSERLALRGEIPAALSMLEEAESLHSLWGVNATAWNILCWYGSLWGYANEVMPACDRAVNLEPDNIEILDSRGLARSLTGDIDGAIHDFSTFIRETEDENRRYQRQNWVEMLRVGENPFTEEVLQLLFID
jgi:tetratricopeptide (TPR) repeat protein